MKPVPPLLRQLCQYVGNTGRDPLLARDFDDDWVPVGESYRAQLAEAGLIIQTPEDQEAGVEASLVLTTAGWEATR